MGNHQNRPSTHGPSQPELNSRFGFGIQSTGGFIQQQDSWITQHRTGDRNALKLAARQIRAPFLQQGVVTLRQISDEAIRVGQKGGLHHLGIGGLASEADRLSDGTGKDCGALGNQGQLTPQIPGPQAGKVVTIEEDSALLGGVEAQQQGKQCAFACSGRSNQGHHSPRRNIQVHPLQHRIIGVVSETHTLQAEITPQLTKGHGVKGIHRLARFPFDLAQSPQGCLTLLELIEVIGDVGDGIDQNDQTRQITAEAGDVEITALNPPGGQAQHREQTEHLDDPHNGMLQGDQVVGALPGLAMLVNFLLKSILQPGFSGKGTHQREPLNRLPKKTSQFTDFFLAAFRGHHHPGPEQADQPDDQRCQ